MKGINIAEALHVVNILPPQDVDGGKTSDVFSLKNHAHATIIVTCGSTNADAGNITIRTDTGDREVALDRVESAKTVFEWGPAPKPGRGSRPGRKKEVAAKS